MIFENSLRWLQEQLETLPRGPQELSKRPPEGPRGSLEGSRSAPEASQTPPRAPQERPRGPQERPGGLQERSKSLPRGFVTPSASKLRSGPRFGPCIGRKRAAQDFKNQSNPSYCVRVLWFGNVQLKSLLDFVLVPFWYLVWEPSGTRDRCNLS